MQLGDYTNINNVPFWAKWNRWCCVAGMDIVNHHSVCG
jgi:hypothetical protein